MTLLEAEPAFGYYASGRSPALFEEFYGLPPTIALNRASLDRHRDAGVLSPRGPMLVARADHRAEYDTDITTLSLDPISVEEARSVVPILNPKTMALAARREGAWDINADLLLQGLLREARANGAEALTAAPVQSIRRERDRWIVTTPKGEHEARILVNAACAWIDRIAASARWALRPIDDQLRGFRRRGHDLRGWEMIFGVGKAGTASWMLASF